MQNLAGKTAFVTGGGSGIGLGIAKALLGAGMKVVIADIREDHLEDAREELDGRGDVLPIPLDVTDRAAFAAAADETERKFGKIHLLVNKSKNRTPGSTSAMQLASSTSSTRFMRRRLSAKVPDTRGAPPP